MNFPIKDFFSKCDQIRSFLRIWSHLLKKLLMENFTFCAVMDSCVSKLQFFFQFFIVWILTLFALITVRLWLDFYMRRILRCGV